MIGSMPLYWALWIRLDIVSTRYLFAPSAFWLLTSSDSLGPPHVHWIAPLIFSAIVGIANYAIYMATIDCSYYALRTSAYADLRKIRHDRRIWPVLSLSYRR
jgi:hypothetical protein